MKRQWLPKIDIPSETISKYFLKTGADDFHLELKLNDVSVNRHFLLQKASGSCWNTAPQNHFIFWKVFEIHGFPKKITLKYYTFCVIRKDGICFFPKIRFFLLDGNKKWYSQKRTLKYDIFCMIAIYDISFSCKYIITFWSENEKRPFSQGNTMKDNISCIISSVDNFFPENMILLYVGKCKMVLLENRKLL